MDIFAVPQDTHFVFVLCVCLFFFFFFFGGGGVRKAYFVLLTIENNTHICIYRQTYRVKQLW